AEDGIRDRNVTGVQTCALPILLPTWSTSFRARWFSRRRCREDSRPARCGEERSEVELEPPPSLWECGNRAPWFWARFPSARLGSASPGRDQPAISAAAATCGCAS